MVKVVATILGLVFVALGVSGFAAPHSLGMQLTPAHNLVHLVSGLVALYYGWRGSLQAAKSLCQVLGTFYCVLGVLGLIAGGARYTLTLVPGQLVFGPADHIVHLLLAGLFLLTALSTRPLRMSEA